MIDAEIGARVKQYREARRLTQASLAAAMTKRGSPMCQSTIAKIEGATRTLRLSEAASLAVILRVGIDQLATGRRTGEAVR